MKPRLLCAAFFLACSLVGYAGDHFVLNLGVAHDSSGNIVELSGTKNADGTYSLATVGSGTTYIVLNTGIAHDPTGQIVKLSANRNNDGTYSIATSGGGGGLTFSGGTAGNVVTAASATTIQDSGTLLTSLAPKASPTFTGTLTAPTINDSGLTASQLIGTDGSKNLTSVTLTTTGTSGAATFSGNTLNIPQYSGGGGTVTGSGLTSGHLLQGAGSSAIQEAGTGATLTNGYLDFNLSGLNTGNNGALKIRSNETGKGDFWVGINSITNSNDTTVPKSIDHKIYFGYNSADSLNYVGTDNSFNLNIESLYYSTGSVFQTEMYFEGKAADGWLIGRPFSITPIWSGHIVTGSIDMDQFAFNSPASTVGGNGANFPYFRFTFPSNTTGAFSVLNGGALNYSGSAADWFNDGGHALISYGSPNIRIGRNDLNFSLGETQSVGNTVTLQFGAGSNGIRYLANGPMQVNNSGTFDDIVGRTGTQTLTGKTYDTAGTGNVFKINGTQISAVTGTGSAVLATSPSLVTPVLGTPSSGTLTNCIGYTDANLSTSDVTTNNVSITKHGFAPKAPNDATKYLDGTGAYSVPAGAGGGVTSITGTANQITASASTGAVTLSLPITVTGVNTFNAASATNLVLNGGSSGASLTLGQGSSGVATVASTAGKPIHLTDNVNGTLRITIPATSPFYTFAWNDASLAFGTQSSDGGTFLNILQLNAPDQNSAGAALNSGNSGYAALRFTDAVNATGRLFINGDSGGTIGLSGTTSSHNIGFGIQSSDNGAVTYQLEIFGSGGVTIGGLADPGANNFAVKGKTTTYNNIATAGVGTPFIVAATRVTAQSAANASIATYTTPASDGSYEVSMNMNVTAATALSTSMNCTYTDESNTSRTMIFPTTSLSGSFLAGGLVTATGAFETPAMHIRCKASTSITLFTATGTFTGVTYTAEGVIRQIQ
jgi:hypothetical protein